MSSNFGTIFDQIAHVAAPYVIYYQESISRDGLIIELTDEDRGNESDRKQLIVPNEKISNTRDVGGLFTRAVVALKKKLQEELAKQCDEPELRLWLAQNREADFMDNSPVPKELRKLYKDHLNPPPLKRRIVRKTADAAPKENAESMPVKTSRGVPVKEQKRVHRCPAHKTEMVYVAERGRWKCPEPGCKIVAAPKQETPVGQIILGRGQLDLRVVYPEDGGKPSIIIIADNNVALDVTDLVDMNKFREFNDFEGAAARAKRAGNGIAEIPGRKASALLFFKKPLRVFGCEHS